MLALFREPAFFCRSDYDKKKQEITGNSAIVLKMISIDGILMQIM